MRLALTSDTQSLENLTLLADNEVTDRLASVDGVADVEVYGDQEKIFRVDIDQARLPPRADRRPTCATRWRRLPSTCRPVR
jgi:HAE1 family hydrophobic/amphiphilic exporter-1